MKTRTRPKYELLYNKGVHCWLGGEAWTLEQAMDWLRVNLKTGHTVTCRPYSDKENK